jgi:hypothetical protein
MGKRKDGSGGVIPQPPKTEDRFVQFSFKYLDLSNTKFRLDQCLDACEYGHVMLLRLSAIESMKVNEFRFGGSPTLRCHAIQWEKTSEKRGFSNLNAQLRANSPWQFSLTANQYGRVHGFFVENTFFVVWLDPKHLLYAG